MLVNGRISESAYLQRRRVKFITAVDAEKNQCHLRAQDQVYADRFKELGALPLID